ncbi:alpha/beta fold hydrolase [Amnibacterium flavum]|uniref:Alpha/beta hydrolase n=1 Tax=Amnibacterium flavum TaxID=2173173 RepID=A0A2V1HRK9_9MICO|nr:alpha/beta fold hydrolase [Amnibacterium flavum]PVZ95256.1 hypothetical protein DDQ50_01655 [Amnibacterium flavum]
MPSEPGIVEVVFIQGAGAGAHDEDAVLAASLAEHLGAGFAVRYPVMPNEEDPDGDAWRRTISETLASGGGPAVLVGHSAGGFQLLAHLAAEEVERSVVAVCLIAVPFPGGDADWTLDGFDLPPRVAEALPTEAAVFLYASRDDDIVPFAHRDLYAAAIPGSVTRTVAGGHQLGDDLRAVADDIKGVMAARRD